ncbi:unnamed protein product [Echinostoma caproni]|uniref:Cilia- and flagella-associated protein 206 n=1 Tax=Echinostoma caproni TaxID=27848 RepID=A0A183ACA1_9TREM|nr:unnamed protein product [Echinostoma caproni]
MCVEKLLDKESPSLDTIKMQVYFELNHLERSELLEITVSDFLAEHHRVMQARLEPVIQEAIDARARTREEMEDVYRKIISAVLLRSGLGSPTNVEVVRETTAALQSIFPQTDVGTYLTSSAVQKRNQLSELTGIVTGIRLFNKDCCKGGSGIDDIPFILAQGIPASLNTLHDELNVARELAATYTSLFQKIMGLDPDPKVLSSATVTAKVAEQDGITADLIRAAVINARQYIAYLIQLEAVLIKMTTVDDRLCSDFKAKLNQLRQLIRDRPAVPSMEVYPLFLELSNIWKDLQNEAVLLSVLTSTLNGIQSYFVGRRLKWKREKLLHLISDAEIDFDDKRRCICATYANEDEYERLLQSLLQFVFDLPKIICKAYLLFHVCQGFCAWSLIRYQGLLVPADRSLGYLLMPPDNRLYAFCSPEAARDFMLAAESFLRAVPDVVRRLPELIQFLKLTDVFAKGIPGPKDVQLIDKHMGHTDAGMQTEVHPIDSYIDKDYEWNEWELRKKALKLANLRKKATSSVQTILSNWRRDNGTQVYLLKDSGTTTKDDGYTQVPRPSVFHHGLRGCGGIDEAVGAKAAIIGNESWCAVYRETNATTVDLTIPVEQQLLGSLNKGRITWY